MITIFFKTIAYFISLIFVSTEMAPPADTGDTAEATDTGDTGSTEDTAKDSGTEETGDSGDSGDSGTTEDTGVELKSAMELAGENGGFGCSAVGNHAALGVTLWMSAMILVLRRKED